jgi:hypothetical protein
VAVASAPQGLPRRVTRAPMTRRPGPQPRDSGVVLVAGFAVAVLHPTGEVCAVPETGLPRPGLQGGGSSVAAEVAAPGHIPLERPREGRRNAHQQASQEREANCRSSLTPSPTPAGE